MKITIYLQTGEYFDDIDHLSCSSAMRVGEQSTGQLLPPADFHILEAMDDQTTITIHV
jgi:3-mercaptopropionate dioxygenase